MTTPLAIKTESFEDPILRELESTQKLCNSLMKTPHYAKLGDVGIFAIVQKAKSIGMSPLDALNGGMYFVQGKVEMQGQAMLAIIRAHGHSISMDPKSTDTCVRMFGRRSDNGDTWTAQFSVEDAKKQGIYRNQWEKMPKIMCQWRCVSQLGRFLFSDILKGVYVQGEIADAIGLDIKAEPFKEIDFKEPLKPLVVEIPITNEQAIELEEIILQCDSKYKERVEKYLKSLGLASVGQLPPSAFEALKNKAIFVRDEFQVSLKKEEKKEDFFEEEKE